eukprot:gene5237-5898_t
MRTSASCSLILMLCIICVSGQFIAQYNSKGSSEKTLWQLLKEDKSVSWFYGVAKKTFMRGILETRTMTIFVPSNAAYKRLSPRLKALLRFNLNKLYYVILYHFIIDGVCPTNVMVDGMMLPVGLDKRAFLNVRKSPLKTDAWIQGKKLVKKDIKARNGVMHVIDGVLLPSEGRLNDLLDRDKHSDIIKSLIQRANIILPTGYTVFTPHDDAFNELTAAGLDMLRNNRRAARRFVLSHIIPKPVFMSTVVSYGPTVLRTMAGSMITLIPKSTGVNIEVEGSNKKHRVLVDKSDLMVSNGVIHSVGHVLSAEEALFKVKWSKPTTAPRTFTAQKPTTLPALTKEITEVPAIKEKPTTLPATTKEVIEAPTTKEEPTTLPATTKEVTEAPAIKEKPTTLPATAKEITEAPTTREEPLPVTTREVTRAPTTKEESTTLPAMTKEVTEAPTTKEDPLPVTTREVTRAPTTKEESTTLPAMTKEVTEAPTTREEPTTLPPTTKEVTEAPTTREEPTALPVTTKEVTKAPTTKEEPTALPVTTKEVTEAPTTKEEPTTLPATTKEVTEAPKTKEEPTTLPPTTKEVTEAPTTKEEPTTLPPTTKEVTEAPTTKDEPTTLPPTTKEVTKVPTTKEEPTTLPPTTKEVTEAPTTKEEPTTLPPTTKEVTEAPTTKEEPTTLPPTTKEVTEAPTTKEEPTTLPPTTKEVTEAPTTKEELTTLPVTTKEVTEAPTTREEPTTIPKTKPTTPTVSVCSKNPIEVCSDVFSFTKLPNNIQQVRAELNQFSALVKTGCSAHVKRYVCSLYTPPCVPGEDIKLLRPCRSLCIAVQDSCIGYLNNVKLADSFDCSKLPSDASGACLGIPKQTTEATRVRPTTQLPNEVVRRKNYEEPILNLKETLLKNKLTVFLKYLNEFDDVRSILTDDAKKYTLFAPTNEAFSNLNGNTRKSFLNDKTYRGQIIKYHIIPRDVKTKEQRFKEFKTLTGRPLIVRSYDKRIMADHAVILSHDQAATNGQVNIIDRLMIPYENHVMTVLMNRDQPSVSLFRKAIELTGMADILKKQSTYRYIVWAPSDDAFLKLSKATLQFMFTNMEVLRNMVNLHITPGYFHTNLMTTRWVYVFRSRIPGIRLRVRKLSQAQNGLLVYNIIDRAARSVQLNLGATNGIINVIDTVLFPPNVKFPDNAKY